MSAKRSHRGIAALEGTPEALELTRQARRAAHPATPSTPDPRRATCTTCGERIAYRRRTYGPNGRAGGWTHLGDGLAQYQSWGTSR